MKILLSNDDGVYAPGINILREHLIEFADITIVAPLEERSATGQTITLDKPLRIEKIKEGIYATSGYPADCTLIGIAHIMKQRPDLVISGINRGANLGQDLYYSGTMAAARQALFHGVPSISVSTVLDGIYSDYQKIHFETAAKFILKLLENKFQENLDKFQMLNINVPNLPSSEIQGSEMTNLCFRQYSEEVDRRLDSRGREYFWIGGKYEGHNGGPGSDSYAIDNKRISINLLNILGQGSDIPSKWSDLLRNIG